MASKVHASMGNEPMECLKRKGSVARICSSVDRSQRRRGAGRQLSAEGAIGRYIKAEFVCHVRVGESSESGESGHAGGREQRGRRGKRGIFGW